MRQRSSSTLREKRIEIIDVLKNPRAIHRQLFSALVPSRFKDFAGGYRGDRGALKNYSVTIQSNQIVGYPPAKVRDAMRKFASDSENAIADLDGVHGDQSISNTDKLIATVEVGCRLIAEFFLIHPFANGNGHVGRFMLIGILGRYGYSMDSFHIHPAPFVPSYGSAIAAYQKSMRNLPGGTRDLFHKYVLQSIKGYS